MNNTTQMMKIKSPKLFYWFRRAIGLFLLFVLNCYNAQVTLIGDVINKTKDSAVYIATGTYVHNLEHVGRDKEYKKTNIVCKTIVKRKHLQRLLSSKRQVSIPIYSYHYAPAKNRETLNFFSATKTAFTINNDHHKRQFTFVVSRYSLDVFILPVSEILTNAAERKLEYSHHYFRIRPPPILNLT